MIASRLSRFDSAAWSEQPPNFEGVLMNLFASENLGEFVLEVVGA